MINTLMMQSLMQTIEVHKLLKSTSIKQLSIRKDRKEFKVNTKECPEPPYLSYIVL